MMRIVCHDALIAAEQLGINTDLLQREATALALQENKVIAITDHMEHKEGYYREKGEYRCSIVYCWCIDARTAVMNVLEETRRVVQLCDKKRDQQDA